MDVVDIALTVSRALKKQANKSCGVKKPAQLRKTINFAHRFKAAAQRLLLQ